uniref:Uncharacterized protein n=1 Tax=Nelumbo nucifera TaxID=4432 RepID=A0A822YIK9_NELNU|nr:TPA_asm: hypothetical protein HUJ06_030716 [Nelumbo nucifera]
MMIAMNDCDRTWICFNRIEKLPPPLFTVVSRKEDCEVSFLGKKIEEEGEEYICVERESEREIRDGTGRSTATGRYSGGDKTEGGRKWGKREKGKRCEGGVGERQAIRKKLGGVSTTLLQFGFERKGTMNNGCWVV